MERQSQVLEVEVEYDGRPHRASYFIEQEAIHANIEGRFLTIPLSSAPAADTVRTVLSGHLSQRSRIQKHASRWSNA